MREREKWGDRNSRNRNACFTLCWDLAWDLINFNKEVGSGVKFGVSRYSKGLGGGKMR